MSILPNWVGIQLHLTFAQELKASSDTAHIPIITMVMPQERAPALQAGCDDYLLRPVYEALPDKAGGD